MIYMIAAEGYKRVQFGDITAVEPLQGYMNRDFDLTTPLRPRRRPLSRSFDRASR